MMDVLRISVYLNALDIKCPLKGPMLKACFPADRLLHSDWIMRPQKPLRSNTLIALLGSSRKLLMGNLVKGNRSRRALF